MSVTPDVLGGIFDPVLKPKVKMLRIVKQDDSVVEFGDDADTKETFSVDHVAQLLQSFRVVTLHAADTVFVATLNTERDSYHVHSIDLFTGNVDQSFLPRKLVAEIALRAWLGDDYTLPYSDELNTLLTDWKTRPVP